MRALLLVDKPRHCEEGVARRGNPRDFSPIYGIATPVCALARNDVRFLEFFDSLKGTQTRALFAAPMGRQAIRESPLRFYENVP